MRGKASLLRGIEMRVAEDALIDGTDMDDEALTGGMEFMVILLAVDGDAIAWNFLFLVGVEIVD